MIYLPSLINKINQFHKDAAEYKAPMVYTSPDDEDEEAAPESGQDIGGPPIYQSAMHIVGILEHPKNGNMDMAEILYAAAEKYKVAAKLKGGYAETISSINHALDQLIDASNEAIEEDEDNEDRIDDLFDQSKDVLDQMKDDLELQEKSVPKDKQTPNDIVHQQLLGISENFLGSGGKEMMQQENRYEMFGAGEGGDKGQTQFGHTIGPEIKNLSDPYERYKKESEDYGKKLTQIPDTPANQKLRENITGLIQISLALNEQANKVSKAKEDLDAIPGDLELTKALHSNEDMLTSLRKQRRLLIRALRNFRINEKKKDLEKQIASTKNKKEKEWLHNKLELENLMISNSWNKHNEIKARQQLINSTGIMVDGEFYPLTLGEEQERKIRDAIDAGEKEKRTRAMIDREVTERRARSRGVESPVKKPSRVGGGVAGGYVQQKDFSKATLPTFLGELSDRLSTAINTAKQEITQIEVNKRKVHNELKPLVDAVSSKVTKPVLIVPKTTQPVPKEPEQAWPPKPETAELMMPKHEAIRILQKEVASLADKKKPIKEFLKNVRLFPYYNKYRKDLYAISSWQSPDGKWLLDNEKRSFTIDLIKKINRLVEVYQEHYHSKYVPGSTNLNPHLEKVNEFLPKIIDYLLNNTLAGEEEIIDAKPIAEVAEEQVITGPRKVIVDFVDKNTGEVIKKDVTMRQLIELGADLQTITNRAGKTMRTVEVDDLENPDPVLKKILESQARISMLMKIAKKTKELHK